MRERVELVDRPAREDIVAYEHNLIGRMVRVYVGVGHDIDGNFVPLPSQTYEPREIVDTDYDGLMAANGNKPAGVFRREDLWPFIDLHRAGKDCRTIVMNRNNAGA